MKIIICALCLVTLACSAGTSVVKPAPAVLSDPKPVQNMPRLSPGTPVRPVYTLGWLRVRSACGIGLVEPPCNTADLGYYEAGAKVSVSGDVIDTSHPDCNKWYPVRWLDATGYVCAEYVTK